MKTYKVAICDDNESTLDIIDGVVKKMFLKLCVQVETERFTSAERLLESVESHGFDLLFLDIAMPNNDGITVGEKIRKRFGDIDIIYVSGCEERVFDTFKVRPFGFVRKSNFTSDITEVTRNYLETVVAKEAPTFTVDSKNGIHTVKCSDIVYFEGYGKVKLLYVKGDEKPILVHNTTLSAIEEELYPLGFIRVHKGILVNYIYISRILTNDVELTTGTLVPMSRRKSAEIKKRYLELIKKTGNIII